MISDVLFEAVAEIDRYIGDPAFPYKGGLRGMIVDLRNRMEAAGVALDFPFERNHKSPLYEALSKRIADLDRLLSDPKSDQEGPLREKFASLRNRMEALRLELDTPLLADPKLWENW